MKQEQNQKPVGVPSELLRPLFWQIARAKQPPFAKHRRLADKSVASVAMLMNISEAEYAAIESGSAAASAKSIVSFCAATRCHPLDLYSIEADARTPLPSEIFYSLVNLSEDPDFVLSDRRRAKDRLELEFKRAVSLMRANSVYLEPFSTALNFVHDKTPHAITPKVIDHSKGRDSLASLFQTSVAEPSRHHSVDRFIIAYQIELERRAGAVESEELDSFMKWCNRLQSRTLLQWYEHADILFGSGDLYNLSHPESRVPFRALG